ncbi:helix-turn-helix domain-containing protein [Catenuloplanes atrovinosus]|uniref:Transcriptional regulator with XRE-family HTH domain n=1 Tax=Catenuloplanes atrovinosus TaxID=137266 RepID=A0AAE4CBN1_9ACTN|nr:helix-turn-helix transcriptional regulator [Catenuloplanes atrovinosus]MDR7278278.1 transcriptional regulator with XRE-family HTH domain [Catenuloplanes atrovinosus]
MSELGDFLRARRAALSPEEIGVPTHGATRRVPGLRREEVAMLAGVSTTYYARLEQGESHQMSDSVLDAVARALRLEQVERLHLARLAWPAQLVRRDPGPDRVRDSLRRMIEGNTEQAAGLLSRHADLLAGNRLFHTLFGLPPGRRVNLALWLFLDPAARDLHVDWPAAAVKMAAYLRMTASEWPGDPELAAVIGELSIGSAEFAELWARHPVRECLHGEYALRHPQVGELTLAEEALVVPDAAGQRLVVLTPAGSDPEWAARLRLLGSL